MTLSPADLDHLRWLLDQLLPASEAEVVFIRHTETPAPTWRQLGQELGMPSLKTHYLYRKGISRLRRPGRLLSGLLLETPGSDR